MQLVLFALLALVGTTAAQSWVVNFNNGNGACPTCPEAATVDPVCHPVEEHWDYASGGADWATTVNIGCGGASQSPIDLPAPGSRDPNPEVLEEAELHVRTGARFFDLTFTNNGHALVAGGFLNSANPPTVEVDGCKRVLAQFHFHTGSEHTVEGNQPAMELHMVFATRSDPSSLFRDHDDLVVVSVMFDGDDGADFTALTGIFSQLEQTPLAADEHFTVNNFDFDAIRDLVVAASSADGFYRYHGSLTTPPCSEIVTWIVATEIQGIPNNFLTAAADILGDNFRLPQDRNGRAVYTMTHA